MDRTRTRPPDKRDPPSEDKALVAGDYQRAPTLISQGAPGRRGAVRVWAPSGLLRLLRTVFLGFVGVGAICVGVSTWHDSWLLAAFYIICGIAIPYIIWCEWRWPVYITTDENRIALTTRKRSVALHWSDIAAVERRDHGHSIKIEAVNQLGPIMVNLMGYWLFGRMDVLECIIDHAGLTAGPENRNRFIHAALAASSSDDADESDWKDFEP